MIKNTFFLFVIFLIFSSCDNYEETTPVEITDEITVGTGIYRFNYQSSNSQIPMDIYYHIPGANLASMPILFVFHGAGRNAVEYRNAWIEEANSREVIIIAPKFSSTDFPGGDGYNLGNVFVDGDNPSPTSLHPEADWAFSVIEPLFDDVKAKLGNTSSTYNIFGFSAGGQFAHRFLMFKPNARLNQMVASASGWYTVPDATVEFPYGIGNCPIENNSPSNYFSKNMTIQIGTQDNDPNATALRRNSASDVQGTNRYDRAYYIYNTSQSIAENLGVPFHWQIIETQGNDHDQRGAVQQAAEVLYE